MTLSGLFFGLVPRHRTKRSHIGANRPAAHPVLLRLGSEAVPARVSKTRAGVDVLSIQRFPVRLRRAAKPTMTSPVLAPLNRANIFRTMPGPCSGKTSCADRPRQGQGMSLDYCRPIVCANPDTGWIPFSAFRSSRQRGLSVPTGKPFSSAFTAHFLLCNLNQIRIQQAAAHSAEQPRRS